MSISRLRRPHRTDFGILCAALLGLLTPWSGARTQPAPFDTTLLRTATVGAMIDGARIGDSLARFSEWLPVVHARFDTFQRQLDRPSLRALRLDVVGNPRAPLAIVGRVHRPELATEADVEALDSLAALMGRVLPPVLRDSAGLSASAINTLLDPREAYLAARRDRSIARSVEKLRRFERKYGPGSPRLNLAEVGLNYVAQWVPGFAPTADEWPSPLEMVASYVPDYVTVAEGDLRAVTVLELGVRRYLWGAQWGDGWLRPGHFSLGVVLAGENDGAFSSPVRGRARVGGYFGWGNLKLAVVAGPNARLLFTRQVQLVPFVF